MVGEKGEGDEFGLGAEESYSILDIARMFGGRMEMRPEVLGNRMNATLDTTKSQGLGWSAQCKLSDYIAEITR